ncbi:hypothetical protein COLO4_37862 [Corchorus olitorius]|uniref:Uncharacterized protein n=1 Tax=Corchorus olitorius TaxID=93759 RepID=A0A1R3FYM5_9ROSI|nr:hypothetical protein COLO4_37862 [Corchorus olitorius]
MENKQDLLRKEVKEGMEDTNRQLQGVYFVLANQQEFMTKMLAQFMSAQQQQFELLKLFLGGKINAGYQEAITEFTSPRPVQFAHTDVSIDERQSKAIEIQASDELMSTEEIVGKLESFNHDLPIFDPDEAGESCIVVHTNLPKENF